MISIAIDGPGGAGKSTLARRLAAELGYLYVDTGAMYRTIALHVLRAGADPQDAPAVEALLKGLGIGLVYRGGVQRMLLNGEDVTDAIRSEEVSAAASKVSAHPAVRAFLLETQRALAREANVLMDGRDIGTVVLPDAQVKIFLTAAPEERARRRVAQLAQRGEQADYDAVLREIMERDYRDTHREAAPLKRAPDAVEVDTTALDFEGSYQALLRLIREKVG